MENLLGGEPVLTAAFSVKMNGRLPGIQLHYFCEKKSSFFSFVCLEQFFLNLFALLSIYAIKQLL